MMLGRPFTIFALAVFCASFRVESLAAEDATVPSSDGNVVASLRDVMDRIMETQKALAKESRESKEASLLLRNRVDLLAQEIENLNRKKSESEKGITEADEKKAELVKQEGALKASLADFANAVPDLEKELRGIQPYLPAPVAEKLKPLFDRMPESGKDSKITLAERCQNVVGILNEVNQANQGINLVSEVRELDGKPAEVRTLYVGLAGAYYLNATGKKAGYGVPGSQGWAWTADDSIASRVKESLAMLESKGKAKFVSLPATITK